VPGAGGKRSKDPVPGVSDFVVVANRLPIDLERLPDGSTRWKRSPGGLVTALEPLLRRRRGAWIGWPGVVDDDVDVEDEPIVEEDLRLHPVRLSAGDVEEYYEGFSNATLWPLYHDVIVKPIYHREWWDRYVDVNRRFAEATSRAAARGATVWVQDYQLQLVPKMLRELRPDLTIGFFLHIPFPPVELFMQLPWRAEIIEGLLGADLVGFHLAGGAQNFLILSRRLIGANTSRGSIGVRSRFGEVDLDGRTVRVGAFPISIDSTELDQKARDRSIRRRAREIRAEIGNPRKVLLGVDRLDYTKGIDVRLKAFAELLAEGRVKADDAVLVQLATPSREQLSEVARGHRAPGGSHQRRIRRSRPSGSALPPSTGSPRRAHRVLRGQRRHACHPVARRDESGRQGVRGMPQRPRRCPGAQRIHRRRSRTAAGLPGQPARHRGRQRRDRGGAQPNRRRGAAPDARIAASGTGPRRRPVGPVLPRCAFCWSSVEQLNPWCDRWRTEILDALSPKGA
jgi:hypothetical protein